MADQRNYSTSEFAQPAARTRQVAAKSKPFASAAARDAWWESEALKPFADKLNTAKRTRMVQRRARALASEVAKLHDNPSPYKTAAANVKELQTTLDSRRKALDNELNLAKQAAKAERNAFQAEINGLIPDQDGARAGEIRSYFRSLDDGARQTTLQQAVQAGDSETVAALVNSPAYLSGLTGEQQAHAKQRYAETHAPEATAALKAVERAEQLASQAAGDAIHHGVLHLENDTLEYAERAEKKRNEELANIDDDGGDGAGDGAGDGGGVEPEAAE